MLLGGQLIQLLGLLCPQGKRLLAQNVLAVLQAQAAVVGVQGVGRGNVYGFHLRVLHQLFVGVIPFWDAVGGGKRLGALCPAGADRCQTFALGAHLTDGVGEFFGDGASG